MRPTRMRGYKKMVRRILYTFVFFTVVSVSDVFAYEYETSSICCETIMPAPNDGTYTRTQNSVTAYTESGHCKGTFVVYLHKGKKYINFNNTWICIQGKSRFAYNGNWYVIK